MKVRIRLFYTLPIWCIYLCAIIFMGCNSKVNAPITVNINAGSSSELMVGNSYTIRWESSDAITGLHISYIVNDIPTTIVDGYDGVSYTWNIPINLKGSSDYKIRVCGTINSDYECGESVAFAIVGVPIVSGALLITEIGNVAFADVRDWIEIYNQSSSPVYLSTVQLKAFSACNIDLEGGFIGIQSVMYDLPNVIMQPKSYTIIEFPFSIEKVYPDDNFENTDQTIFISNQQADGTGCRPYIHNSGELFFELVVDGKTEDYVVTQDLSSTLTSLNIDPSSFDYAPTTGSFSGGIPKVAIPPEKQFISSGRDKNNTDTDSGSDWAIQPMATYGGPNDITNDVDGDDDGIPDEAEMPGGTFAGLPLYEWGARVNQKDVFIHVDYMESGQNIYGLVPRREALQKVVNAFKKRNIHLHIDVGDLYHPSSGVSIDDFDLSTISHQRPFAQRVRFLFEDGAIGPNVFITKHKHFPNARKNIFHYAFFINAVGPPSNQGALLGRGEIIGNDFVVSVAETVTLIAERNASILTPIDIRNAEINFQSSVFMHELGHNIGLEHGGDESLNLKPNYFSVMNYMYIIGLPPTDSSIGDRYYHIKEFDRYRYLNNLSNNIFGNSSQYVIDYSDGSSIDLNESQLLESSGIGRGNQNIDWNIDGTISTTPNVVHDINFDNKLTTISDYNDWGNLIFNFNDNTNRLFYFKKNLNEEQQKQRLPPIYNDYQPLSPPCIFPIRHYIYKNN